MLATLRLRFAAITVMMSAFVLTPAIPTVLYTPSAAHRSVSVCVADLGKICLTLTGTVEDQSGGKPIGGSIVEFNGSTTITQPSTGIYSLTIPISISKGCVNLFVVAWAPGYGEFRDPQPDLCGLSGLAETVDWSPIPLTSMYVGDICEATLSGLPPVTTSDSLRTTVSGHSSAKICLGPQSQLFVMTPDGTVTTSHLNEHKTGDEFQYSATIDLSEAGIYYVEILGDSGVAFFDVPIFVGVKPTTLPDGPQFSDDPSHASKSKLADFAVGLLNSVRIQSGLKPFTVDHRLTKAAQFHAEDMAKHGYYYTHPHIGSDGSTQDGRAHAQGVNCGGPVGESIGGEPPELYPNQIVGGVMDSLLISPFHHELMLSARYKTVGIGVAYDSSNDLTELTIELCPGS